ncbi:MAG: FMN-binding protein [Kofleriaceae bacterium]|nr:FMN-binding protein [Kofleriaceae bacterium]
MACILRNQATEIAASLLVAVLGLLLVPLAARADVCVWRDPERTMTELFPTATDYRTVTKRITPDLARAIEERIGIALDDPERAEFNYYEITGRAEDGSQRIGTVLALAGAGDYGAIEVVIGLDPGDRIVGVHIQRMRERNADKIRSDSFLGQFRGKSKEDPLQIGRDVEPVAEAPTASQTIALAVRKMVVFYDVLRSGGNT